MATMQDKDVMLTHGHDVERSSLEKGGKRRSSLPAAFGNDTNAIEGQLFSMNDLDPALDAKMRLVNNAINQIGWTNFHTKLFCLNGFGYMADSLILVIQSVIAGQAGAEFQPSFANGLTFASYAGMLVGALFWGGSADIIGRKFAFNVSLFLSAIFAIIAGASPNWIVLGLFVSIAAFGAGGNLVLDTTVFLEYLPANKQYLVTTLAAWWGLAPLFPAAFAWPLFSDSRFACNIDEPSTCTRANNQGWRYIWYGCGGLILLMSIARITVIRLKETPKFLLGQGKDAEVVENLQGIAKRYNRQCDLTLEQLAACGTVTSAHRSGVQEFMIHFRGLFATRKLGISTSLIWFSWTLIGLAYPLFYVFLPQYLRARGANTGAGSPNEVGCARHDLVEGEFASSASSQSKANSLKRYTMVVGALVTMVFFFAYTAVRTHAANLGFTCAIYFTVNVYYGTLYAYSPEVLPSAHRGTGNGIAIACNRVMGLVSAAVATSANTATSAPIYICAVLYIVMAIVAVLMPFEPYGKNSM
ncbi:Major Facilitator superfamily [Lithohypha guttulata]|uniref:Major Facilitator superfamily n=1 Tax=Lithohypha guttulata TaxID=1690604 RepID=A0AAN7T1S7_9EURO|nr:Major Facilitator superfamily [Lithohypha guttulata]